MILPFIDLAIVFHCITFGIFFILRTKRGIGNTNLYLGSLLILLSIISIPFALKPTGWMFYVPYLTDLEWAAGFLLAPIYLWYVKEMTGEQVNFTWKNYLLLIPGLIVLLYFGKFYFLSTQEQNDYLHLVQYTYIEAYQIGDAIFYPYIQGYFIYTIVLLYKRRNKVSGIFKENLSWLIKYTILLLSFGFFAAIVFFLQLPQIYIDSLPLLSACIYLILIYKFLQQSGRSISFEDGGIKEPKSKYTGSSLDTEAALKLNEDLLAAMNKGKLFLQPDLTLQTLAKEIKATPHHLSQVINQYHQKNFSDFINVHRVKEAQRLILENGHLKLEAIGYESGFNTKATFNAAFKKVTGCTPSEYRKKEQEKDVKTYNI